MFPCAPTYLTHTHTQINGKFLPVCSSSHFNLFSNPLLSQMLLQQTDFKSKLSFISAAWFCNFMTYNDFGFGCNGMNHHQFCILIEFLHGNWSHLCLPLLQTQCQPKKTRVHGLSFYLLQCLILVCKAYGNPNLYLGVTPNMDEASIHHPINGPVCRKL